MRSRGSYRHFPAIVLALLTLGSAAAAQPTFNKTFEPATIGPGSVSTLRFAITNGSSQPARDLAFTDGLPPGVTIATPSKVASSCLGSLSAPGGGSVITLSGGGVGAGSSCSITVDVTSATAGAHVNVSGDLISDAGNSGSATATLTVATDRPGFTKSFSPGSIFFGGRSTLTFTVDNSANAATAFGLTFTDNLPAGMLVAGPANASSTCTGGSLIAVPGTGVVSYGPSFPGDASVAAGTSCTLSVDVVGNSVGVLGNTSGELTSIQAGPVRSSGKAAASLAVTVERIALSKSFTDDPVAPGGTVNLGLTVRNLDRRSAASDIAFTDDLEATLSGLVAIGLPVADPCGPGSQLAGTSVLALTGGNLPPEGSCTFSLSLQVPGSATAGSFTNTTSSITAIVDGQPVTGNPATDVLFVDTLPELTKTFLESPVGLGDAVTMELTITNTNASAAATGIGFSDNLDAFVSGIAVTALPANGFCGAGATMTTALIAGEQHLVMTGGELAASGSCTFTVGLQLPVGAGGGVFTNTTSGVTATIDGRSVTGSVATADLVVAAAPTLQKVFLEDPVAPGDTATMQLTLELGEEAASGATEIAFTDDLTATLSGLTAVGLPLADVCGVGSQISGSTNLSFSGGSLSPGESCSVTVSLDVPEAAIPGTYTNTTSNVVAAVAGVTATGAPGQADLRIAGLSLSKSFVDDPVNAGDSVTLEFTLENTSASLDATDITFSDDLDAALDGLAATGLPLADVCGSGSSLTGQSGDRFLLFQDGSLNAGASCSFSVTLEVPFGTPTGLYANTTSSLVATIAGGTVALDPATDGLEVVSDLLVLQKEFTDDPVAPGGTVTLELTLSNLAGKAITDIAFTDDLDAALAGLASTSGTLNDVCGTGSQVGGSGLLTFTGGSLAAGASCTFSVSLAVPPGVAVGTEATNTTSAVSGSLMGFAVTGDPATDVLQVDALAFGKAFEGSVEAGETVGLTFTIQNPSQEDTVVGISFSDDLDAVLAGLVATGLPALDVCGEGSQLVGTSFLTLSGGELLPGGSCTFGVVLAVPASAAAGSYLNVTSELLQNGLRAAAPATATLTVIEVTDSDGDGVLDELDVCPGTVIPEGVPTVRLGKNRYALVDGDGIFDTSPSEGNGPGEVFTTDDTAGCSCEQIIAAQGLGQGHVKFGCSIGAMRDWVDLVNP